MCLRKRCGIVCCIGAISILQQLLQVTQQGSISFKMQEGTRRHCFHLSCSFKYDLSSWK